MLMDAGSPALDAHGARLCRKIGKRRGPVKFRGGRPCIIASGFVSLYMHSPGRGALRRR